jgi:ParB-like chromosome segregation protein Spo0J
MCIDEIKMIKLGPINVRKKDYAHHKTEYQGKRGTVVELQIVVPEVVRSRPSGADFKIF